MDILWHCCHKARRLIWKYSHMTLTIAFDLIHLHVHTHHIIWYEYVFLFNIFSLNDKLFHIFKQKKEEEEEKKGDILVVTVD